MGLGLRPSGEEVAEPGYLFVDGGDGLGMGGLLVLGVLWVRSRFCRTKWRSCGAGLSSGRLMGGLSLRCGARVTGVL